MLPHLSTIQTRVLMSLASEPHWRRSFGCSQVSSLSLRVAELPQGGMRRASTARQ